MSGKRLIAAGLALVVFGIVSYWCFDIFSESHSFATEITAIAVGAVLALIGLGLELNWWRSRTTVEFGSLQDSGTSVGPAFVTPAVVIGVIVALAAYALLAELADFHLITFRTPGKSAVFHRGDECAILWTVFWSARGWIRCWRRRTIGSARRLWMICLIPLAYGILHAGWQGWLAYHDRITSPLPQPGQWPAWLNLLVLSAPLFPLIQNAVLSGCLILQVRVWRRVLATGVCRKCGYNLTGNVSGRCPECGEEVEGSKSGA